MTLSLAARAARYNLAHPDWPPLHVSGRWLYGIWMLGNDYRGSGFYGSYPPGYLRRVMTMFPDVDAARVLHLFSGALPPDTPGTRLDIQGEADIIGDAHRLSECAPGPWDLILADPPYSCEDSVHYGTPMVDRNRVVRECAKVIAPGGWLVWLDQVWPMFRKDALHFCGTIGVFRSTNHRYRMVGLFERVGR